eukprot:COSAG01_NODE_2183_length_8208_cov_4.918486_11_plen_101_part_00
MGAGRSDRSAAPALRMAGCSCLLALRAMPLQLVVWDFDWSLVNENTDTYVFDHRLLISCSACVAHIRRQPWALRCHSLQQHSESWAPLLQKWARFVVHYQ